MSHILTSLNAAEIPPQLVLRAALARDFCAFIEFTFGVLRPSTPFRPNWHIEAMAHKLAQIRFRRNQANSLSPSTTQS